MKFAKLVVLCTSIAVSTLTLANCPPLKKISFGCVEINHKKHCNWRAPWWEGYGSSTAQAHEHPAKFIEVYWGPSQDPNIGSTNCFYFDHSGGWVELSQNSWGGVPKPLNAPWKDGQWPKPEKGMTGRVCDQSIESCQFNYG